MRYIDSYGRHKVMFGTDFPVLTFERYRQEVDALGLPWSHKSISP